MVFLDTLLVTTITILNDLNICSYSQYTGGVELMHLKKVKKQAFITGWPREAERIYLF